MSDINDVTLVGRLVEKPVLKYGKSGTAVSNLRVANNTYMPSAVDSNKTKVNFFTVVVFGKQAENCEKYLDKGRQIVINGRLDQNSWEDNSGNKRSMVRIIANRIQFIGGQAKSGSAISGPAADNAKDIPGEEIPPEAANPGTPENKELDTTFESPIEDTDDIPF
ncbi:MAG: single-stranded DNA-binding protein [bacterium]|nr:single-stranded DNA-binding protein [bacterium]